MGSMSNQPSRDTTPDPVQPKPTFEEVLDRLNKALRRSCADETELTWIHSQRLSMGSHGRSTKVHTLGDSTILVRTLDNKRLGSHRAVLSPELSIEDTVRQSVAHSRSRSASPLKSFAPRSESMPIDLKSHVDPAIDQLSVSGAKKLLGSLGKRRERHAMRWGGTDIAIVNSRGLETGTRVSGLALEVWSGRRMGAGRAARSWRKLDKSGLATVYQTARDRDASGDIADLPEGGVPIALGPEATARIWGLIHDAGFSASAYRPQESFLRKYSGTQVFDSRISLIDDGTDPKGLALPIDFEGCRKRRVSLIKKGVPQGPALDLRQAAIFGLKATGHSVAGNDSRASHLFLSSGELDDDQVLHSANGGLWIGWISHIECFDSQRMLFRAHASNVRRIVDGKREAPVFDLIWEDSLLRVGAAISGLGTTTATWSPESLLGSWSGPSMVVSGVDNLRVRPGLA